MASVDDRIADLYARTPTLARMWCGVCRADEVFERPHSPEPHAAATGTGTARTSTPDECPEWLCTGCGAAYIDPVIDPAQSEIDVRPARVRAGRHHVA